VNAVEFGTLFQFIRNGMNVKQDKSGDGLPITRIETISEATVDAARVGYANLRESDCRGWLMEEGDILFSHINSVEHVGKCAVYRGAPGKLVHGMNLLSMRCDSSKLLPEFAKYLMRGPEFRKRLSNFINKAVNQASVSISNLKTIPVTVPPVEEQRRIAEALDRAEALRAKRRAALAQLDTLTQSIFLDLFGDPARNPKGLRTISVGELGEWQSGGTPPRGREDYFEGSVPWFSSGELNVMFVSESQEHISEVALRETSAKAVPSGALMLGMYDTAALKASIAGVRCSCNQAIAFAKIDARIAETVFVYFSIVIGREHFRRLQRGIRQKNLNLSMIRELRIPLPELSIQREFVQHVTSGEKLKAAHNASLAKIDALFAALQHRAFRGEL
jgi:type I restriction enzyme, S subunit